MRRVLIVLVSVLGLVMPVGATSLSDFSKAYQVETTGKAAYYALSVPAVVYAGVHKTKLEDLRFFSSDRIMLPHAVFRRYIDPSYEEPIETLRSLKFTSSSEGVLLDLAQIGRAPGRIDLKWQKPAALKALEISRDKKKWQVLLNETAITGQSFSNGGYSCLAVPTITSRYVRLVTAGKVVELRVALPANLALEADPQRSWLNLRSAAAGPAGEHLFDSGGFMPFDRFKFKLSNGQRAHIKLYARNSQGEAWQLLADDIFYRFRLGSEYVAKDTVLLKPEARRFLRLVVDRPADKQLALSAGWMPDRMVFVAQGKPPYILGFGSDKVEKLDPVSYPQLLKLTSPEAKMIGVAKLGKPVGTGARLFIIFAFLLVMALVATSIWIMLRKPENDAPQETQQAEDDRA